MSMFHRHQWVITSVQPVDVYAHSKSTRPSYAETHLSLRCRGCGKPKLRVIRGHWSPGQ